MINEDVQDEESVNILVRKRDETYMIISKDDAKKLSSLFECPLSVRKIRHKKL